LKGIYTLIIQLKASASIKIGALGRIKLPKNKYLYTGSARGSGASSIEGRIGRHLRKTKRSFWHIDYLLNHELSQILALVYSETQRSMECKVNDSIRRELRASSSAPHFGSSDCACQTHLLQVADERTIEQLVKSVRLSYRRLSLDSNFLCYSYPRMYWPQSM
jgi:Uri superfamily endonuclease